MGPTQVTAQAISQGAWSSGAGTGEYVGVRRQMKINSYSDCDYLKPVRCSRTRLNLPRAEPDQHYVKRET